MDSFKNVLVFDQQGPALDLPDWARFYIDLGKSLPSNMTPNSQMITALSAPTRSFIAAFIAFGIVWGNAVLHDRQLDEIGHFLMLRGLLANTPLIWKDGLKEKKAIFKEYRENTVFGPALWVQIAGTDKQGARSDHRGFTPKQSLALRVAPNPFDKIPVNQDGRLSLTDSQLVRFLLDQAAADNFAATSRLDCLIIGTKRVLFNELDLRLLISNRVYGTLQDMVQCRNLPAYDNTYKSLISSGLSKSMAKLEDEPPSFVIFDGASSYLRFCNYFPRSNWMIVIDRTSIRSLPEAAQSINDLYGERMPQSVNLGLRSLPDSIELISFMRARDDTAV
jgi:hypothetical protein